MKKTAYRKTGPKRLGQRITDGLTELREVLKSGKTLERHFRVDIMEIPDPPHFTAARIKTLRQKLRMPQGIFARLLGVSVELVEHWEQGIRQPRPIACRLMNEIERDPKGYIERLRLAGQAA